jgi:hypothetical protein
MYVHIENIGGFQTKKPTSVDDMVVMASEKEIV